MIVVNAATIANDFAVISSRLKAGAQLERHLRRHRQARPPGAAVAGDAGRDLRAGNRRHPLFQVHQDARSSEVEAIVSRTGYTGELGYEIFLPAEKTVELWDLLLADERVKPAGLGARDLLRLEVGYSLYGSDIDETTTPLEAGLAAFVNFDKEFVGREALLQAAEARDSAGSRWRSGWFPAALPATTTRYATRGQTVGSVTSGAFSPMLGCGIGLGSGQAGRRGDRHPAHHPSRECQHGSDGLRIAVLQGRIAAA